MSAKYAGHHDPSSMLKVTVALKLRNTEQLDEFLRAVTDPTSPEYHQFLTPQQFTAMYGPTQDQVNAVVNYLESQEIHVTDVTPDDLAIHIQAKSGLLERVLGIQINDYSVHGAGGYASQNNPEFPSDIVSSIQTVFGLSNIEHARSMLVKTPNSQDLQDSIIQTSVPLSTTPGGYSPGQVATAYNWPSITDKTNGSGVTIAIATADSAGLSNGDFNEFWSYYGLPSHTVTVIPVDGNTTLSDGDIETTIDTERSGAMAPGAAILVYDENGETPANFYDVYHRIVTDNNAQVVTTSWGFAEQCTPQTEPICISNSQMAADDTIFEEAVALGMAVFAADGDYGSSDCYFPPCNSAVDIALYPSSDPYVVAAGGTTLTLNGNNTIASEIAWSDTGGAESDYFVEPSWQTGIGVPQNSWRNTSDMSMDADPNTGYSVYYGGRWIVPYGGTSFVAPELAGLFAIQVSLSGSTRLGPANSAIYADANSSYHTSDFHDITSGSNGAFSAGVGWDHPTGWGSPNAVELLTHIGSGTDLSVPVNFSREYAGCYGGDKYIISWSAGPVGKPTDYDLEYGYDDTDFTSIYFGTKKSYTVTLTPSIYVGIRIRATNGVIWSNYSSIAFVTSPCLPPPSPSGN
ncbi:MAG: S53 family peptidase [Gammaproteobacteria bacterium]